MNAPSIPSMLEGVIVSTPDTLSGALRFHGTRVYLQALLDGIAAAESVEDFLDSYPSVSRAQVEAVLAWQRSVAEEALGHDRAAS